MYRKRQTDQHFPKPIKLGDRGVGFSEKEVDDYIQMRIETCGIFEIVMKNPPHLTYDGQTHFAN